MLLLDRLLIRSFIKSYVICLVCLLTLYVVVDLFTNLDDFTDQHNGLHDVLHHIAAYYGYKVTQIFDRLSEVIVLLAATFTVALIQRNNELLPLLSAGVPTRRVVFPVLVCACGMLGLSVANQELVISRIGNNLMNDRDDPEGKKDLLVQGAYEPNGIHVEGRVAKREGLRVQKFFVVIPEHFAGYNISLSAEEARYVPPREGDPHSGGWLMTGTQPETLENWNNRVLELIDPGKYFLRTQSVDFESVTRSRTWFVFASTARLRRELSKADAARMAAMAVLFHMRLTRPVLGLILVLMGLGVILRDQNRNVFISAGLCLLLCGLFFAAQFACKSLGDSEYVSPALAAWLPVLAFGPFSLAMFDAIHT
jgi:lipopolysaccharide export system permease protein